MDDDDNKADDNKADYKIVVVGERASRTAITIRFVTGQFVKDYEYDSWNDDSYYKKSEVEYNSEKENVTFKILNVNTRTQEEFSILRNTWARQSNCFLMVYSIDDRQTFNQLPDFLGPIAREHEVNEEPIFICLVGNKCDLSAASRFVGMAEGQQFADDIPRILAEKRGIAPDSNVDHMVRRCFLETSAKTGTNITEAFHAFVKMQKQFERDELESRRRNKNSNNIGISITQAFKALTKSSNTVTSKPKNSSHKINKNNFNESGSKQNATKER